MAQLPDPRSRHRVWTPVILALPAILVSSLSAQAERPVAAPPVQDSTERADEDKTPPHPLDVRMWEILREMRIKPLPPLEEIGPRLAKSSGGRIATLYDALEAGKVPGAGGIPAQALSIYQRDLILEAFRHLDPRFVIGEARRRVATPDLPAARRSAIQAAGAVGDASSLAWILNLTSDPKAKGADKALEAAVEDAFAEILQRDPTAHERLQSLWRQVPFDLRPAVIRAVGEAGSPRSFDLLSEMLAWHGEHAALTIAQIPRIGASDSFEKNTELCDHIRPFLDPADPGLCRVATLALGELEDLRAVPLLIELLGDESARLDENVVWALRRITGLSFPASQEIWSFWLESEMTWARRHKVRVVADLGSVDEELLVVAIRDASRHPLFRHELSGALCGVLTHGRARMRALACRTLQQLSSPVAAVPLAERLEDRAEDVRTAAWEALQSITGEKLPPDQYAWLAVLEE